MVTGSQLTFSLSQVKRTTVGLCVTGDKEHDESDDGRNVTLNDQPFPRTCLRLDDATELHSAAKHHCRDHAQAETHLIRNHLHGTTHGRDNRILVVGAPSRKDDAEDTDAADGRDHKHADVEVEHGSALVPRQEREGAH